MKIKFELEPPGFRQTLTRLLENGLFWMALVLITIGGVTTFYYQGNIALRTETVKVSTAAAAKIHTVGEKELPISSVKTDQPLLSLTFDLTGSKENLHQIIDTLSSHNIKASFFLTGTWLDKNPEEAAYILSQGHDLGSSGETHQNMSQLEPAAIKEELLLLHNQVKEQTGYAMNLFRPPYGDYNNLVISTSLELNYQPVTCNLPSYDWKDYGIQSLVDTVTKNPELENGSIIELHTGAKYTPKALESMITELQKAGYQLVPLSQLLLEDNYYLDQKGCQITSPKQ